MGHSVGGGLIGILPIAPQAFQAIMTLPQPSAFAAVNRFDGQCPCCRREFADAQGRV